MKTLNKLADKKNKKSLAERVAECCPDCTSSTLTCPCGCDPQGT